MKRVPTVIISLSYLTCALDSEADAVDAYGLNVYSWCDEAWSQQGHSLNSLNHPRIWK